MMWLGTSPRSWMMYSPRSVSIGTMPCSARWSLSPISSEIIDLPLVTVFAPTRRQMSRISRAGVVRRLGEVDFAALLRHALLVGFEIEVEMIERVVLERARLLAQRLEFGKRLGRLRALVDEVVTDVVQRPLKLRIGERVAGVFLEAVGGDLHQL